MPRNALQTSAACTGPRQGLGYGFPNGRKAHRLIVRAVVLASFLGVLTLTAQASASGPMAGALGALGATATQQLAAVAHDAPPVPLPAPASPATPAANDVAQAADPVPQALTTTTATVRASASDVAERARVGRPSESGARSESTDGQSGSPSEPGLAAVAERAGRVTPSVGPTSTEPARIVPLRTVTTAHEIVSPAAERVAKRLEHTVQGAPVARHLGERASRVAGALIGTVVSFAKAARSALSALPSLGKASPLQPTIASPALPGPELTHAATTANQPSNGQTPLATSTTAAGLAPATAATPIATGAIRAVPAQAVTSRRQAPPKGHAAARARHSAKPSLASRGAQPAPTRAKPALTSSALALPPTPSPGGVSPAGGAGVSAGLSASTLLALAALLLLAGPRAMRRLRLAAGSRRPAQFVLIPERPG